MRAMVTTAEAAANRASQSSVSPFLASAYVNSNTPDSSAAILKELTHVDRTPIRAVCVLGKDLRMLIRRYAVWVKYSGGDVQKLSTEYERGCQAERGTIVHESVLLIPC